MPRRFRPAGHFHSAPRKHAPDGGEPGRRQTVRDAIANIKPSIVAVGARFSDQRLPPVTRRRKVHVFAGGLPTSAAGCRNVYLESGLAESSDGNPIVLLVGGQLGRGIRPNPPLVAPGAYSGRPGTVPGRPGIFPRGAASRSPGRIGEPSPSVCGRGFDFNMLLYGAGAGRVSGVFGQASAANNTVLAPAKARSAATVATDALSRTMSASISSAGHLVGFAAHINSMDGTVGSPENTLPLLIYLCGFGIQPSAPRGFVTRPVTISHGRISLCARNRLSIVGVGGRQRFEQARKVIPMLKLVPFLAAATL